MSGRTVLATAECLPGPEWVLSTVPVGDGPVAVGVDSARSRTYVVSRGSGTVTVLDTQTLGILQVWDVGPNPVALAVSSKDASVYVVRRADAQSTLLRLDAETGEVKLEKLLNIVVADIGVHPDGGRVYIVGWDGTQTRGSESSNGAIMVIDGTSGQFTALRLLGGAFFRYRMVAVTPTDGRVLATWTHRYGRNGIDAFNSITLDRIGSLSPDSDNAFTGIAFDRGGRRLFLSTTWQWVNAVDIDLPLQRPSGPLEGDLLLGRADAGRPSRLVHDEATRTLYVTRWPLDDAGETTRDLVVIDAQTLHVMGSVPVGAGQHGIALDAASHRVFVTNAADATVTVIQGRRPESEC